MTNLLSSMSGINNMDDQGLTNNLGPIDPFNQGQMTRQLQNILQFQLMKNITTGNFILDTVIQVIMMAFVTYTITQIKYILDYITGKISLLFYYLYRNGKFYYLKIIGKNQTFTKTVDVPYISDNRQINELYKAVQWFLSSNSEIDYIKESNLQYVYEKKLQPDSIITELNINKILNQGKVKDILFKKNKISFLLDTETITIYTDKEKKRENFKIKLWTEIDLNCKHDIIEEFCQMCINKYIESLTSSTWKQLIYTNKEGKWESKESKNARKLDTVLLQNSIKESIKLDMELFLNSEEWYSHRDIPYTRGYLLYGIPGTGKTSLIKSLSLHFKRHMHYLMLQNIKSDTELLELLQSINYKETILVIEDIDAGSSIVKARKNDADSSIVNAKKNDTDISIVKTKKSNKHNIIIQDENEIQEKITLSGLLNALDGVFNNNGRIMIITTNHPELLDQALTRHGRIDSKYQFNNCSRDQIKDLYYMFFDKEPNNDQLEKIKLFEYSPAQISSVFLRYRNNPDVALEHLDDKENDIIM